MIFAGLSYFAAAFALLALAGFLLSRHRQSDLARRVAIVCFVSAVWAGLLAFSARLGERREWIEIAADSLRYGGWLFALSTSDARRFHPWIVRSAFALCAVLVLLAAIGAALAGTTLPFIDPVQLHSVS